MTNTRRSQVQNNEDAEESPPEKPQVERSPGRKRKQQPDIEVISESASVSRPKRNARKSVLLASGDFEVTYPGVKEEEPDGEEGLSPQMSRSKKSRSDEQAERSDGEVDVEGGIDDKPSYISNDGNMSVDVEVEIETMSHLDDQTDDMMITMKEYSDGEGEYEEDDDMPPRLEKVKGNPLEAKRKRGRPRKYPLGQTQFRRTNSVVRPRPSIGRPPGFPRNKYTYEKPITKTEAEKINSFNVKLFEDEIGITEHGEPYATVIPGCLSYLLRKERIIDLLTNRNEITTISSQGWLMKKAPRLPPLVSSKACFAFYIDGSEVVSVRDLSSDDLKPWTSSVSDPCEGEPVIKPNVRKHAITRQGGRLIPSKGDPRSADIHLTEYSAWLPRCLRLRKKIFYLSRGGHIIGNVLILYDFTNTGEIPVLVNVIHGNEAFRAQITDEEFEKGHLLFVGDNEDPFLEDVVPGPRGERFLHVRNDKLGWTNNKKLLLKYLINEPALLDNTGFLNHRIPYLPPLIETRGVFVHFAPSNYVADQIHFTGDGLSPWTFQGATVNHRVRTVKRALIQDAMGVFMTSKEDWQATGLALVETITILCRCPRLRKRILYVQRNNSVVLGNVCFIYEYMRDGPIPDIIKSNTKAGSVVHSIDPGHTIIPISQMEYKRKPVMEHGDEMIDVEQIVEEEIVHDDMHEIHVERRGHDVSRLDDYEDLPEDSLDGGWDTEFEEDVLSTQDNPAPFFDGVRQLESGHSYLTVRHKRVASNVETILEFIANSSFVEDKDLVNTSKPAHPPLVRNARAYVFFVAGNAVFPHDINRDDFSPWSANATPENPTCYRSKVRKVGVLCDPKSGHFSLQDGDYKMYPYHLVALYSIHPKEARLRKRIAYLMDTDSKVIVSHVMVMYDFNTEGPIPHISGPYGKRSVRRRARRLGNESAGPDEVIDDVSDLSESEKDSPFSHGPQQNTDNTIYLPLADPEFLNDRNRQLHYLLNKPHFLESMDCLNSRVPMFPPLIPGKGAFVFFIDGNEVDVRNLTCDGLAPWSENMHMSDGTIMCRRPKSHKLPLSLNREGQLRVVRGRRPGDMHDFTMHIYAATLPRLPRLKKRVIYIAKDGVQIGHSMIAYLYSEEGELPQPVAHGNSVHADNVYVRLPPSLKDDARKMLHSMTPQEAAKELSDRHGIPVNTRSIYNVKREMNRIVGTQGRMRSYDVKPDNSFDELDDSMADYVPAWADDRRSSSIVDTTTVEVGQEVTSSIRQATRIRKAGMSTTGVTPRAHQTEQVFRFVSGLLNTRTDNETFDAVWRILMHKNETRILQNIKNDFGVEIIAESGRVGDSIEVAVSNDVMDESVMQQHILEEVMVEEVVNEEDIGDQVVIDTTLDDNSHVSDMPPDNVLQHVDDDLADYDDMDHSNQENPDHSEGSNSQVNQIQL